MNKPHMRYMLNLAPQPVLHFGHYGYTTDDIAPQDARFFAVYPVPTPNPNLIVMDDLDMMRSAFDFDIDRKVTDLTGYLTMRGRLDFAALDMSIHLEGHKRAGCPFIVLGVSPMDAMFNGSYPQFLRLASVALGDALRKSPHFDNCYDDWREAHTQGLEFVDDASPSRSWQTPELAHGVKYTKINLEKGS